MKYIWLILVLLPVFSVAQGVPKDVDSPTIQVVTQEHKNTRKFFSDELTRQRNEFFKQMDDRADYYEETADDIVGDAVWKLGLMWGGVVLFVFGISNFLGRRLEKRKWNKMLDSAKAEIMADVNQEKAKNQLEHSQKEEQIIKATKVLSEQESTLQGKREALKKARPQLVAMQQKMKQQQAELDQVMQNLPLFEE